MCVCIFTCMYMSMLTIRERELYRKLWKRNCIATVRILYADRTCSFKLIRLDTVKMWSCQGDVQPSSDPTIAACPCQIWWPFLKQLVRSD